MLSYNTYFLGKNKLKFAKGAYLLLWKADFRLVFSTLLSLHVQFSLGTSSEAGLARVGNLLTSAVQVKL